MTDTTTIAAAPGIAGLTRFTPAQLLRVARLFTTAPHLTDALDLSASERQWALLESTPNLQVWLLGWPAGASTGWHDHHAAAGAFHVVRGELHEGSYAGGFRERDLTAGEGRAFSSKHIHDVSNRGEEVAVSVHVYAPALTHMTRYEVDGDRLRATGIEQAGVDW